MRLLLLSLAFLVSAAHAQGIERFQSFLRDTTSWRAEFEQQVYGAGGKRIQESKGTFMFHRPGRFRWVYAKPVDQVIVGDGERVWIYDRDLDQVTVRKLSQALGSTPAALLSGAADVEAAFALRDLGQRDGLAWVEARPKETDAGFERILLGFAPEGLRAMELVDQFGQTTRLRFTKVQRNPRLDPGEFRFEPPPGVDVLGER